MVSTFYRSGHTSPQPPGTGVVSAPTRLSRQQQDDLLAWVQVWYDAGCAVHPAKPDGSKYAVAVRHGSPDVQSDVFPDTYRSGRFAGMPHPRAGQPNPEAGQHGYGWGRIATGDLPRLTPQQIATYVRSGKSDGIGVFCGLASGGLVMLEAEGRARDLLAKVGEAADRLGATHLWDRLRHGCVEESPSTGVHFFLRVTEGDTPGNTLLAARPLADGQQGQDVLFETRGQGGWSVVAPSAGRTHGTGKAYRFLRGSPATIPDFTAAEYALLCSVFQSFDERPAEVATTAPAGDQSTRRVLAKRERPAGEVFPGDDFNERASWDDVLTGWTKVGEHGGRTLWRRPGKSDGQSASTTDTTLCCFSSSAGLPVFKGKGCTNALSKFSAYAHLHHSGNFGAAAWTLWKKGYGNWLDDDDDPVIAPDLPVAPRPTPSGAARDLTDWRGEVAARRAVAVTQPGLHIDRSPTGAGKTHATIVALGGVSSSLTVLPTHANVRERVEEMRQHGIDAVAYPELTPDTCQNYGEASHAQRLGLVAGAAVCPTCPFKDQCAYRAAAKVADNADHRVGTHERLRRSSRAAEGVNVVVIDEMPEDVLAPTLTASISEITPVATLAHAIRNFFWSKADPDQKSFAGAMLDTVDAIHRACESAGTAGVVAVDLERGHDVPQDWQRLLYRSISQVGAGSLSAEALTLVTKAAAGELDTLHIVTDRTCRDRLVHFVVGGWKPALPPDVAVIALDATCAPSDLSAAVGQPVDDCTPDGHLAPQHEVAQLTDDITRTTSAETVAGVVEAFLRRHPEVQRLGIIGHQPHIRAMIDDEVLSPWARARLAKWCYFGQGPDRASNDWHGACDGGLVLGTPRPNPGAYRRWLVQHGLHDAARRSPGWGRRAWASVTVDGQPCTVAGSGYDDPDWQRAYVAVTGAALFQSVGRWRSILPEGVPVTVVTSDPTPFPVAPPLETAPATVRETVETVRALLASPGGGWGKTPIGNPYRKNSPSGSVPTHAIVRAVAAATASTTKSAGVSRDAVKKRLRAALTAGLLVQPKRGWWSLAADVAPVVVADPVTPAIALYPAPDLPVVSPAPYPRDPNTSETATGAALNVPIPAHHLHPGIVIRTLPPVSKPDITVVIAAPVEATGTSTTTLSSPATVLDPDDRLMLVEERAAILEFDGGHQRDVADRLAVDMVLGTAAVAVAPTTGPTPVGVLPADVADIRARELPLVRDALKVFGGAVRRLPDRPAGAVDPRRPRPRRPGQCACGHDDKWVPIPIHGGRSSRVECGHCERFGWWGVWYGVRQPSPFDEAQPAKPPPLPPPMDSVPAVTQVPA